MFAPALGRGPDASAPVSPAPPCCTDPVSTRWPREIMLSGFVRTPVASFNRFVGFIKSIIPLSMFRPTLPISSIFWLADEALVADKRADDGVRVHPRTLALVEA